MEKEIDKAFDRLRCKVVLQAIDDYRRLARGDKRIEEDATYEEIEEFFASKWCKSLLYDIKITPRDLIEYCRKYKYKTFRKRLEKMRDKYKGGDHTEEKIARNIQRLLDDGNVWLTTDEADVITHNLFFDIGIELFLSEHGASLALLEEGL